MILNNYIGDNIYHNSDIYRMKYYIQSYNWQLVLTLNLFHQSIYNNQRIIFYNKILDFIKYLYRCIHS